MIEYIFAKRIKESKGVTGKQNLLLKKPLQIGLDEVDFTEFDGGFIVLDFGKEMNGGVRILTYVSDNVKIRIRFGESLSECYTEVGEKNATNDHSLRDFTVNLQSYSDMTFGSTGFRFVRIDFEGYVALKSVVAVNHILRKKSIFSYNGKDKEISKIFSVAKRTIDLCASGDYLVDGIKRDRLVWIGDMHPEMLALTTLYGRMEIIERSLDFVKDQTPIPKWMNKIPSYSLWWIIIVCDYYKITGAKDFLDNQIEYLGNLIKFLDGFISKDGELKYPMYFCDWPTHDTNEEEAGVRAINIIAIKKAVELYKVYKMDDSLLLDMLNRLNKKEITAKKYKQILGLKYFATKLTKEDKEILVRGGAKGISTFMSYYILKAVASFDKEKAISMMKEYYGSMLKKGATTFFEDYDIEWAKNSNRIDKLPKKGQKDIHGDFGRFCYQGFRHSLCHGWSAGVIPFIKEKIEND